MGRTLIVLGLLLVVAGCATIALERMGASASVPGGMHSWWSRLPFGRMPGDIHYRGRKVTVFAPLGTSLLLSALLTLLLLVLARLRR